MTWTNSALVDSAWRDFSRDDPSLQYLGGPASPSHLASSPTSGHNGGPGQESPRVHPDTGVTWEYPWGKVHALDLGHGGDVLKAGKIVNRYMQGPRRKDVRYCISQGRVIIPIHRGGGTQSGSGHTTHVHMSGEPWGSTSSAPWLARQMTDADRRRIEAQARAEARNRPFLKLMDGRKNWMTGKYVRDVQAILNLPITGTYGLGTRRAVVKFQRLFKAFGADIRVTGRVDRKTWEALLFVNLAHFYGF